MIVKRLRVVLDLLCEVSCMAKYDGTCSRCAGRILDASQGRPGHRHGRLGHPRGHVSDPAATAPTPDLRAICSVENFSRTGSKTAFESAEEQNEAVHFVLTSEEAQMAMEQLNRGAITRKGVTVPLSGMRSSLQGAHWKNGTKTSDLIRIEKVTVVLQHHQDQQNNRNADVHVLTAYPTLPS